MRKLKKNKNVFMKRKKKKKKFEKEKKRKKEKEIIYKEFSTLSTLNTNENAFLFVFIPSFAFV